MGLTGRINREGPKATHCGPSVSLLVAVACRSATAARPCDRPGTLSAHGSPDAGEEDPRAERGEPG
jgi:hypothetical protein